MTYPLLFSPITIRGHEISNRGVITAHGASESFRTRGDSPEVYIEYLRRRAADGVGLIIAQPPFFMPGIGQPQWLVDRHAQLAERIHAEGGKVILQLANLGVYARSDGDVHRPPLWGFENTQSAAGETAHQMTDDEVEEMVAAYRATARMAAQADLDGVEVHGAHGYLIQQALTPSFNSREDRWGQDRTLFARSILRAAREEVGEERIVSYRTVTDDLRSPDDGGIGFQDGVELLLRILADGEVDLLNTTIGDGGVSYARAIPDYRYSEAPNIPAVARLREAGHITIPIIGVGKIASVGVAESVLASGACDLIAMTRAHIADPDLLAKARAGVTERIRPCVGANVCVNRKLAGYREISCFHNPEVLREDELELKPAQRAQHILVVGAGPAGLKAAEIAAKRGHQVTLVDRNRRAGGRLRSTEATAAAALAASLDYILTELGAAGVHPVLGVTVDDAYIDALAPDHVIIATGAVSDHQKAFPDDESVRIVGSDEALRGDADLGRDVLVYDGVGANEGVLTAEALARAGCRVTFVTPFEVPAPQAGQLHRVQLAQTFAKLMHRVITGAVIGAVDEGTAVVVTATGDDIADLQPTTIVAITPPHPVDTLVEICRNRALPFDVVGDASAPRLAMQAFKDGYEAGLRV